MSMNINDFVREHYNIKFCGNGVNREDLSGVEEFLLGESHIQPLGTQRINALFIRQFINREGDLVLVEGSPSMQSVNIMEHGQTEQLGGDLRVFGWDYNDSVDQSNSLGQKYPQFATAIKCNKYINSLMFQYLDLPEQEQNARIPEFQEKFQAAKKDALEVQKGLSQEDVMSYYGELMQIADSSDLFVQRTNSMIETLVEAQKIADKRFLIAGFVHLVPDAESLGQHPTPEQKQSVAEFLSFLADRNAVVLLAKERSIFYETEKCIKTMEKIGSLEFKG